MKTLFLSILVAAALCAWSGGAESADPSASARKAVFVAGFVEPGGAVAWTPNLTLRNALARAGYDGRKFDRVAVVRGDQRIRVELAALWSGKIKGPKLQPGDSIEVPELGPDPGAITIIRGSERIQVKKADLLRKGSVDPRIEADDLIFVP